MSYSDKCILRKQELDAFIAQAFAPELMNSQYLQELTVSELFLPFTEYIFMFRYLLRRPASSSICSHFKIILAVPKLGTVYNN